MGLAFVAGSETKSSVNFCFKSVPTKQDMDPLFARILNSARQFLKDVNEFSRADEGLLVKLETNLQAIWRIEEKGDECINFLKDTCNRVLHSGYIILICKIAALSKVYREMSQEESEFPKPMQPKVREIRSYKDSIQKQHEKIDACMEKIMTRVSSEIPENVG